MAQRRDALTELVQQHVGTHRGSDRLSVAEFVRRAFDPDTQYRPSNGLVGKIVAGESYKVTPELVSAIAAGLGIPRDVVGVAAHFQLIGYDDVELEGDPQVRLVKMLGAEGDDDTPKARAVAQRWADEDSAEQA